MLDFAKRFFVPKKPTREDSSSEKIALLLEDLNLLEDYVRDLLAFSPLPLCSLSPRGVILEVNPAFEELSGYKAYEIVGTPIDQLFDKEAIEEVVQETFEKGTVAAKELALLTKERREIPVSAFARARRSPEGETVGCFLGLFALGGIKETEHELRESQAAVFNILEDVDEARIKAEEERDKTLAIINNFADGLLVFDEEGNLSLINPQAENLFDVKSRDVIGRPILELSTFPTLEPVATLLGREVKGVFRKELPIKENLTLEVSAVPAMSGEKKLVTLVIAHDITREKRIEQLKTEFVSLSAHQLRTPLSAIKWTLQMLLGGDLGEISQEQQEYIKKTADSTERMITLINDLLNVTRIEEGRYLYKPVLSRLQPVVQAAIEAHQEEIARKNIKLEFHKPSKGLPPVRLDEEQIQLAVQNLIDNAISYTPPGGRIKISLNYAIKKSEIALSVADSGIGIPQDQQERVFTKFFRGSNAMRMATEGSGLGLYITKHIIEAHGGKIWFESEEGKGTTFHLTLPAGKEF